MDDQSRCGTVKSSTSSKNVPKCVCSWKNCRAYQKAYQSYNHPLLDGVVKVKLIKNDTASMALKASLDRTLKVPKEKRHNWQPARGGGEILRYHIAKHHFTEAHIKKFMEDPKRYKWTSFFSKEEAQKYLFKLDTRETISLGDDNCYYVQCPNVSKDYCKQQFHRMKEEMEAQERKRREAERKKLLQKQAETNDLGNFFSQVNMNGNNTVTTEGQETKDTLTVSTGVSLELIAKKEEDNERLRKELDACQSQLTMLTEMVRRLQEETADNMSVYSRRSTRSRRRRDGAGGKRNFPNEILLDDDESQWDGGDPEEDDQDWSENEDDDETILDDGSFAFAGNPVKKDGKVRRASMTSKASIEAASVMVKSLPREIELEEHEAHSNGSDDSSMEDAFDDQSYVSRGSRVSRVSRNHQSVSGSQCSKRSGRRRRGGSRMGNSTVGSGSVNSNQSHVETYEVKQQVIIDPYGEKGTYAGSLSRATGMPHGKGRLEYAAGRWYEGDWKHGRWTGRGRLSNGDGDLYEGELRNDHKHGHGTMRFADGRVFVGQYMNGQMVKGRMTYQDGSMFDGSWMDGMRHGHGKCVFTDNSIYEGDFREGEFHGHGKMSWSDGGWYEGEWWNGEMQGHGKEVRQDGSLRHEGAWSKGQPLRNRR